ncbi:UvrD-helicase domain-containing protein [Thiorhodovibrio litoralis]|uniref:UvrD-helicase domain-containing protein n=1 Tax=Thiorhodovibrio litoralis TaxID=2952932 RepID=UPI002B263BFB|nr:UvrD-helicase domain-containing protein [Thiorhodovibrio litoralis]WPL12472.1 helicase-exonuclease AddAB, AddA subunit [Thiorhodovibrio litoralis]
MKNFSELQNQVTIIQAVAGSGKTYRLKKLVKKARSNWEITQEQILVATFSRALAKELNIELQEDGHASTLHAFGRQIIGRNTSFLGYSQIPQVEKNPAILKECFEQSVENKLAKTKANKFFTLFEEKGSLVKSVCRALNVDNQTAKTILESYAKEKQRRNIITFGDMFRLSIKVVRAFMSVITIIAGPISKPFEGHGMRVGSRGPLLADSGKPES